MTMKAASEVISEEYGIRKVKKFLYRCKNCGQNVYDISVFKQDKEIAKYKFLCRCGWEKERRQQEVKTTLELEKRSNQKLLENCGIDDIEKVISIKATTHKGNIKAYNYVYEFVNDFDNRTIGILLFGPPGSGKTHLAKRTMIHILKRDYNKAICLYLPVHRLYDQILDSYKTNVSIENYLLYLENVDLLVLDDLGTEKNNEDAVERIFRLIEARGNKKPTIITTNLNESEIENRYGKRTTSRLFEYYDIFAVSGIDFRKKQNAERNKRYE